MSRDRAAYMRDYRAKNRAVPGVSAEGADLRQANERIADLEAEVVRLKRELAMRQPVAQFGMGGGGTIAASTAQWVPEFRPAPKPGQKPTK